MTHAASRYWFMSMCRGFYTGTTFIALFVDSGLRWRGWRRWSVRFNQLLCTVWDKPRFLARSPSTTTNSWNSGKCPNTTNTRHLYSRCGRGWYPVGFAWTPVSTSFWYKPVRLLGRSQLFTRLPKCAWFWRQSGTFHIEVKDYGAGTSGSDLCNWGILETDMQRFFIYQYSNSLWNAYEIETITLADFCILGGGLGMGSLVYSRTENDPIAATFPRR